MSAPAAFLGMSSAFALPTVRLCMSCPDLLQAEANARAAGHDMTHGLCPACSIKLLAELPPFQFAQSNESASKQSADLADVLAGALQG